MAVIKSKKIYQKLELKRSLKQPENILGSRHFERVSCKTANNFFKDGLYKRILKHALF